MTTISDGGAPLIEAVAIRKNFDTGTGRIEVLKGIDLTVVRGEMVAVIGASGSGKTTLLQILGTLDLASGGSLRFDGHVLDKRSDGELSRHRNRNIGFIFQFHHLLPEFTALENVLMPGLIANEGLGRLRGHALDLLDRVGLSARAEHRPGELSGGEQQRVALARALIMRPSLLLADEPTGNLDSRAGRLVFDLLKEMSEAFGLATVMVTHNLELAGEMDRCLTLTDGVLNG